MSRRTRFVQLAFTIALVAALCFSSQAVAQGGTTVRVDPAATTLAVGQTGTVSIKVDNVSNLSAFELHLSFNPAVMEVVQLANGGFLLPDVVAQNTFNNTAGTIDYAIAQLNTHAPASGNGTLLVITVRGKANGTSSLAYQGVPAAPGGVILSDPNGTAISANLVPGTVTVGSGGPTPTSGPPITPTRTSTPMAPTFTPIPGAPTPTPVSPGYGVLGYHIVQPGETLYCIGRGYKVTPWSIAYVNYIPWPYFVYTGQKLAIPNSPWYNIPAGPICAPQFGTGQQPTPTPAPPQATQTPPPPGQQCRYHHYVLPGQTLYSISVYYGVPMYAIQQANGIVNPNLIYAYTYLCIP